MRRTLLLTVVSDWLPKLVAFLAVVLVARKLGASSFAYFAVALSWIGYAWWAVDLGQAGYSIRTLAASAGSEQRRLGSEIFSLYLALAVAVSAVLVLLLLVTGAGSTQNGRLLLAMSPYLVAYAVFPDWWLRARGQLVQLGAANWAVVLCCLTVWVVVPPSEPVVYALAFGLSPLAGAAVAMLVLSRTSGVPRWVASWRAWKGHLQTSLLFGAAGVGGQVAVPLALATMTSTGSTQAAGAFALGMRAAAAAANALWLLLQNALPPLLARARPMSGRVVLGASLPGLLGVGAGVLLWQPVLAPLVGPSYTGAAGYAALGALLLAVWGPKYVVEIGLIVGYRDKQRIVVNMLAPVLVIGAAVTGLAVARSWVMPVVLLAAEGLAAVVGYVLLRRTRPATAADVAEGTKRASAVDG